ncbi:hypothetical protein D3C76_1749840 [compost metagenome]
MSGKPVEHSISDFIKRESKNNKTKIKKAQTKIIPNDYKMKTVQEVVQHIEYLKTCFSGEQKEMLKALQCSITGEEYVYNQSQ